MCGLLLWSIQSSIVSTVVVVVVVIFRGFTGDEKGSSFRTTTGWTDDGQNKGLRENCSPFIRRRWWWRWSKCLIYFYIKTHVRCSGNCDPGWFLGLMEPGPKEQSSPFSVILSKIRELFFLYRMYNKLYTILLTFINGSYLKKKKIKSLILKFVKNVRNCCLYDQNHVQKS